MRIISRTGNAAKAAAHWRATYASGVHGQDKLAILDMLDALGSNPDPDTVDEVIGNTSWTCCYCDECRAACEQVIEVGQEPDYESATAKLCKACVIKAASTMIIG